MTATAQKRHLIWHLREWREHVGLTQEQLAERVNTNKGQISKLETGGQRLNDDWILKLSSALNIEPGDLLRHPTDITLPDLLRGATEEQRQAVRRMVAGFLNRA